MDRFTPKIAGDDWNHPRMTGNDRASNSALIPRRSHNDSAALCAMIKGIVQPAFALGGGLRNGCTQIDHVSARFDAIDDCCC